VTPQSSRKGGKPGTAKTQRTQSWPEKKAAAAQRRKRIEAYLDRGFGSAWLPGSNCWTTQNKGEYFSPVFGIKCESKNAMENVAAWLMNPPLTGPEINNTSQTYGRRGLLLGGDLEIRLS
jgi:hypothetical protein